jgi:hypothetical protein
MFWAASGWDSPGNSAASHDNGKASGFRPPVTELTETRYELTLFFEYHAGESTATHWSQE